MHKPKFYYRRTITVAFQKESCFFQINPYGWYPDQHKTCFYMCFLFMDFAGGYQSTKLWDLVFIFYTVEWNIFTEKQRT